MPRPGESGKSAFCAFFAYPPSYERCPQRHFRPPTSQSAPNCSKNNKARADMTGGRPLSRVKAPKNARNVEKCGVRTHSDCTGPPPSVLVGFSFSCPGFLRSLKPDPGQGFSEHSSRFSPPLGGLGALVRGSSCLATPTVRLALFALPGARVRRSAPLDLANGPTVTDHTSEQRLHRGEPPSATF